VQLRHLPGGLAKDRKAGKVFCAVSTLKIECQQRFLVADISFYGKGMVGSTNESHQQLLKKRASATLKRASQYSLGIDKIQPLETFYFIATMRQRATANPRSPTGLAALRQRRSVIGRRPRLQALPILTDGFLRS
jgi:hypothetical protein